MGYLEGFYYNPRIDKQLLREHTEGLIGLSACLGGEIAQTLEKRGAEAAEEVGAASTRTSSARATSSSSCMPNGLRRAGARSTASSIEMSQEDSASRSSRPTTATTSTRPTRARTTILMCVQQKQDASTTRSGCTHRNDAFFMKSPAEMDGVLQAHPRGAGERRADRRAVQRRVQAGRDLPAEVPGARRR